MSENGAIRPYAGPNTKMLCICLLAHSVKPIPLGIPLNVPLTTICMMFPHYEHPVDIK